jgi:WD40 repeat protein
MKEALEDMTAEAGVVSAEALVGASGGVTAHDSFRHRGPVTCVAGIPHARAAVSSGYDGAVGLFDLETRRSELLGYHRHLVNRITVNPQGTRAASSSSDYTICIWDLRARRPALVLRGHSDDVEDFAFIDDETGVSASRDHRVIVWDLKTGAATRVIDEHEKDVLAVAYADGKIYTSGDDMTLRQWSLQTGAMLKKWGPFEQETDTCAIDPLHGRVILGCDDGFIRVFDIETGEPVREFAAHASGIKKVAASPTTGDVLSAAYDQRILVWDAETFGLKAEMEGLPTTWERSLNWSPDGARVLAGTFDGTVVEWDASSGQRLGEIGGAAGETGNACFNDVSANADGEVVLVSDDGYLRSARLRPDEARWLARVEPASGRMLMNAVTLDDANGLVVAGAHDHKLHIFRKVGGELRDEVEVALGQGPINCVRVAHNPGAAGEIFAACYSGAVVRVTPRGEIKGLIRVHEGAVKALRIHPTKDIGVSCGADNLLLSWSLTGELIERFPGHTAIVDDVDIDPTGEFIASTSRDFTVKVYSLSDGKLRHSVLLGHRSPKSLAFWSSGEVVIGDYWGALIKVELDGGRVTRRTIARNGISSLARSGEHLVAASYDGAAYLVRPEDLTVVRTIRAMTQRLEETSVV